MDTGEELPPELAESIRQDWADGVYFSIDRHDPDLPVTAIHWHPGNRNVLAENIIEHVTEPMPIDLNGHWYEIRPLDRP